LEFQLHKGFLCNHGNNKPCRRSTVKPIGDKHWATDGWAMLRYARVKIREYNKIKVGVMLTKISVRMKICSRLFTNYVTPEGEGVEPAVTGVGSQLGLCYGHW